MAGAGPRGLPPSQALVRRVGKTPRGAERMRGNVRTSASWTTGQAVVANAVRSQAVREALKRIVGGAHRGRSAAMRVEQFEQRVHGLGGGHAQAVAARGAHHGAANRVVLQAFAAFEVLQGGSLDCARV